jgi:hypothetical protein
LEDIAKKLSGKYGQKMPITIHRGEVHEYLGMTIDYSEAGKVKFNMQDCVCGILEEAPEDMDGKAITPATLNLFMVREDAEKLDDRKAEMYHHLTAKLLYLCKQAHLDLQTAVSFLITQVTGLDKDDWKKLARCIRYLQDSKDLYLILETEDGITVKWWIDASFAVHPP